MARFNENNTEGFTAAEMDEMNRALDLLAKQGHEDDENHIGDFITNEYQAGKTAEDYVAAYRATYLRNVA